MSPSNEPPSMDLSYSFGASSSTTNDHLTMSFCSGTESSVLTASSWREAGYNPDGDQLYTGSESSWDTCGSFHSEEANAPSPPPRKRSRMTRAPLASTAEVEQASERRSETPSKTRQARARKACEHCRIKKSRCDENTPKCRTCAEAGIECVYKETKPGKKTQSLDELYSTIIQLRNTMIETHRTNIEMKSNFIKLENELRSIKDSIAEVRCFLSNEHTGEIVPMPVQPVLDQPNGLALPRYQDTLAIRTTSKNIPADIQKLEVYDRADEDVLQGNLSIPFHHSTPAHMLAQSWKGIQSFYGDLPYDYVMDRERNREPIALAASAIFEQKTPLSSPPQSPYLHRIRKTDEYTTPAQVDLQMRTESFLIRSENGRTELLELEARRAQGMWKAYLEHIHILHPFLDVGHISEIIEKICVSAARVGQFETSPNHDSIRMTTLSNQQAQSPCSAKKRKRRDHAGEKYQGHFSSKGRAIPFSVEKATDTAIVLLVFALGEICQAQDLRGGIYESFLTSPHEASKGPISVLSAGPPPIRYSTFASAGLYLDVPMQDEHIKKESHGMGHTPERLVSIDAESDTIPGLAYYVSASRILGLLSGVAHLPCVHANLLAGLYAAQLLRPRESWERIQNAGHSMQLILQEYPNSMSMNLKSPWLNSIRITYWACLQLESDLLAEFDFPPSGISRFEERVPIPVDYEEMASSVGDHSVDIKFIMTCFAQQIHLRKVLNRTHSALYSQDAATRSKRGWESLTPSHLIDSLEDWKISLRNNPQHLSWEDAEEPSTDMNHARMRAKHYGAKVIMNRGYLKRVVDAYEPIAPSPSSSFSSDISHATSSSAETRADPASLDDETLEGAARCVSALIQSTKAFDNLATMPRRLIVTNLFGTAQAQFGNILVLAAVVKCGSLSSLISLDEFEPLLTRTINFIGSLAPMSDTMQTNLQVLYEIQKQLIPAK